MFMENMEKVRRSLILDVKNSFLEIFCKNHAQFVIGMIDQNVMLEK